ncbi:MAG: preprotein translocase subunit SecY [Gammaproteobacteria bacterium]
MNKSLAKSKAATPALGELTSRLLFVVLAILVYRIGAHIPVPNLDPERLAQIFSQQQSGIVGLFNMFSGGALSRLTVFALGVMPYISASIIMQLLTAVSPKLEQLKKEGEAGRRKLNQYTRVGTLLLAFFQAIGLAKLLVSSNIALYGGFSFYFTTSLTLATGTMFLMWLGEQITERGIGNGISLIIFTGILSGFPAAIARTFGQLREGQLNVLHMLLVGLIVVGVTAFVVFMERAQRRITVNYAQRQMGKKVYQAQTSHLPLKINMAGVIPPIFATSLILFPATLATWFAKTPGFAWLGNLGLMLSQGQPLYILVFTIGVIFFCFFYSALVFNPKETADNLKKSGAYIPGIRPGEQTANYIDSVMTKLIMVGALYVSAVCLLPEFMNYTWHVPFLFGGTSLLIIVVVIMDVIAQIQAHLMSHQYGSLMKKAKLKV